MSDHLLPPLRAGMTNRGGAEEASPQTQLLQLGQTRFGGLHKRYWGGKRAAIRCVDPISCKHVEFRTELHRDNWLLRRFDPRVTCIQTEQALRALYRGQVLVARPHLQFERNGEVYVDYVTSDSTGEGQQFDQLRLAADAHGLTCQVRTRTVVRSNVLLIENLDVFRRTLTASIDAPREAFAGLSLDLRPGQSITRMEYLHQVRRRLSLDESLIDAFLIHCFLRQRIQMNIEEVLYGPGTYIEAI